jgi:hypothetical protein
VLMLFWLSTVLVNMTQVNYILPLCNFTNWLETSTNCIYFAQLPIPSSEFGLPSWPLGFGLLVVRCVREGTPSCKRYALLLHFPVYALVLAGLDLSTDVIRSRCECRRKKVETSLAGCWCRNTWGIGETLFGYFRPECVTRSLAINERTL